jgi:amino acid transporter
MKKIKIIFTAALIAFSLFSFSLSAQDPPPPPPGHGTGGNVPGGGAPIAGGIGILLALGAVYGGKKVWDFHLAGRQVSKRKPAE